VGSVSSSEPPSSVLGERIEGAEGALAVKLDLTRLADLTASTLDLSKHESRILSRLGVLTKSVRVETDALSGSARLELRESGQ